jgi:hypothetical protein
MNYFFWKNLLHTLKVYFNTNAIKKIPFQIKL